MRKNHITTLPEFMLRRKMTFTFLWKPFEQKPASYPQCNNVNEIQSWKCVSLKKLVRVSFLNLYKNELKLYWKQLAITCWNKCYGN